MTDDIILQLPPGATRQFVMLDIERHPNAYLVVYACAALSKLTFAELVVGHHLVIWIPAETQRPALMPMAAMRDLVQRVVESDGAAVVAFPTIEGVTLTLLSDPRPSHEPRGAT